MPQAEAIKVGGGGKLPQQYFHSKGWRSTGGYANAEIDRLLDAACSDLDLTRRGQLDILAERRIAEDAPGFFILHKNVHQAFHKRGGGYECLPLLEGYVAQFSRQHERFINSEATEIFRRNAVGDGGLYVGTTLEA